MLIRSQWVTHLQPREARLQDAKNRQNSIELDDESDLHYAWREKQREVIHKARSVYEWAIQNGIKKSKLL